MTVTQLVIDAETAAEYLSHNRSNRPVSESHVRRLANDMVEGRWRLSTDAIGFDTTDRLVNGQHRLRALVLAAEQAVEAEVELPFLVATGLPEDSYPVLDQGRLRGVAAVLHAEGIPHYTSTSVVARQILFYDRCPDSVWKGTEDISRVETTAFALSHREELYNAEPWSPARHFPLNTSSFCSLHYLVNRDSAYEDRWDEWKEGIVVGANLGPRDPRLVLRNSDSTARWGLSGAQPRLGSYIKAWNAFVEGRTPAYFRLLKSELPMPVVL